MKRFWMLMLMAAGSCCLMNAQVLKYDSPVNTTKAAGATGHFAEATVYSVPIGYTFVLQFAGAFCSSALPMRGAQLFTSGPLASSLNYRLPISTNTFTNPGDSSNPPTNFFESSFAAPVHAYIPGGTDVVINVFGASHDSQSISCTYSVSGYLSKTN